MVRPFRRPMRCACWPRRILAGAASVASSSGSAPSFEDSGGQTAGGWPRGAGGQAYSHIRRDVLHPLGPDGVRPYAEFTGEATFGPVRAGDPAGRRAAARRTTRSGPAGAISSWRGECPRRTSARSSSTAACSTARWTGTGARSGRRASALSNYGYDAGRGWPSTSDPDASGCQASARPLQDEPDSLGQTVHRYFFAHRLRRPVLATGCAWRSGRRSVRVGRRPRLRRPATGTRSPCCSGQPYGLGADGNVLLGARRALARVRRGPRSRPSWRWTICSTRTRRAKTDIPTAGPSPSPRSDPLGSRLGWRAFYTQASSLAFRTLNPFENFTDAGVGLGPQLRRHGPAHAARSRCRSRAAGC